MVLMAVMRTMAVPMAMPVAGLTIMMKMLAAAGFERDLIVERTLAGRTAARARGRLGGCKAKLNHRQAAQLKALSAPPCYCSIRLSVKKRFPPNAPESLLGIFTK